MYIYILIQMSIIRALCQNVSALVRIQRAHVRRARAQCTITPCALLCACEVCLCIRSHKHNAASVRCLPSHKTQIRYAWRVRIYTNNTYG